MSNENVYDISQYTDNEMFDMLDLVQPSDRVLEAKIIQMINKYKTLSNDSGKQLADFFRNMYAHFFEDEDEEEGFQNIKTEFSETQQKPENAIQKQESENLLKVTNEVVQVNPTAFKKDRLNPILSQTVKRIISIDSQYRDKTVYPSATDFTFNLSEPLRDVLALRLYSVSLPITWHNMNSKYGGNFFYLKGNSPGIDNGNFDYIIEIESGSYKPQELVDRVNTQLQQLKTVYTDVSFGRTALTLNPNNFLSNLTIDVKNIFNETNYTWSFEDDPTLNPYPLARDASFQLLRYINTRHTSTLSAFLGFNEFTYSPNCIQSNQTLSISNNVSNQKIYVDTDPIYNIDSTNNYFTIVQYQGSIDSLGYITNYNDISINQIKIQLSLTGSQTRNAIVNDLSGQIYNHPDLLYSSIERIDISDNKQGAGFSFFRLTLNLNKKTTIQLKNVKTCVVFPNETNVNPVWVSNNSCFQFPSNTMELNVIKGETIVRQSSYNTDGNTYFVLKCKTEGYRIFDTNYGTPGNYSDLSNMSKNTPDVSYKYTDLSTNYWNDYKVTIPQSNYSLTEYVNAINNAIQITNRQSINTQFNPTGVFNMEKMGFIVDTSNRITFRIDLNKNFTTQNYELDFSDTLLQNAEVIEFNNNQPIFDLSKTNVLTSSIIEEKSSYIATSANNVVLKIRPNRTNTNAAATQVWTITMENGTFSLEYFINAINRAFNQFSDAPNSYPLQGTNLTIKYSANNNISLILNMNIVKTLTQNDYELYFYDASYNINPNTNQSSWKTNFEFDNSYNIASYSISNTSYTDISSTLINEEFTYFLPRETTIRISPQDFNGLNLRTLSPYTITIPAAPSEKSNRYTLNDLMVIINDQFKLNPELFGTYINIEPDANNNLYTIIRVNINNIYTASDYKVVFYDFINFAKCEPGKKLEKATKDTTIGWLLGFRLNTEYDLNNYFSFGSSFAIIRGDTTMTSNLYNYFLITIDDYIQNHLNDGLVTLTQSENFGTMPSYATRNTFQCSPEGERIFTGSISDLTGNSLTQNQIYSANQIHLAQQARQKEYSMGPYTQDIFGLLPLKLGEIGSSYTEFGGTLQNQERMYFGPVNIHRMTIKLITDKGDTVEFNGNDWSFSFVCEQLYQHSAL